MSRKPPTDDVKVKAQKRLSALVTGRARDGRPEAKQLLAGIKAALPDLLALRERFEEHWGCEDRVYRFYHQSWKVFDLQDLTAAAVGRFRALMPGRVLNDWFEQIVTEGTGKKFATEHNARWLEVTRPIVEAFFHARYFLDMISKYGRRLRTPPAMLPSGWAAVLYLYNLR